MKISVLSMIALTAALTGCAASGPKHAEIAKTIPALSADQGRVFYYRSSSMLGAAIQPNINLDGKVVGESKPGGFFYVDAAAGSHETMVSTEATNKLSFVLDKGETKYVRTSISMGVFAGHVVPTLVSADEAKKEIGDLSYTGKPVVK
jgi:hypothetical protein